MCSFLILYKMESICGTTRSKIIIFAIGLLLVVAIPLIIVFTGGTSTNVVQTTTEQITTTTESLFSYKMIWAE